MHLDIHLQNPCLLYLNFNTSFIKQVEDIFNSFNETFNKEAVKNLDALTTLSALRAKRDLTLAALGGKALAVVVPAMNPVTIVTVVAIVVIIAIGWMWWKMTWVETEVDNAAMHELSYRTDVDY